LERGRHFAAFEWQELFVNELRTGFRKLRRRTFMARPQSGNA
jgi:hypothetical protein